MSARQMSQKSCHFLQRTCKKYRKNLQQISLKTCKKYRKNLQKISLKTWNFLALEISENKNKYNFFNNLFLKIFSDINMHLNVIRVIFTGALKEKKVKFFKNFNF